MLFSKDEFAHPPAEFSPSYFWMLNGKADAAELKLQLQDMAAHGLRNVCFTTISRDFRPEEYGSRFNLDYLSDEYLDLIEELVEECQRLEMHFWLYDETGWPSGGAGGRVVKHRPGQFPHRELTIGPDGHAQVVTLPEELDAPSPYPALLSPGATEAFLEETHEKYAKRLVEYFGETIKFAFTDEPNFGTEKEWPPELPEFFERLYGAPIEPWMDKLAQPAADNEPAELTRARIAFHDARSRLFAMRYMAPLKEWCHAHGLRSGGHFNHDDTPLPVAYGTDHILRAERNLDIPGVDAIARHIFPGQPANPFPRYASSAARQFHDELALAEIGCVYGSGFTWEQYRWICAYLMVRGVPFIINGIYPQSQRKHLSYVATRPQMGPGDPQWRNSTLAHLWTARMAYLAGVGKAAEHIAVYFPMRDFWAGAQYAAKAEASHLALAKALDEKQCDFDYIDDDSITEAVIESGKLIIGEVAYDTVVLPDCQWLSDAAAEKLALFEADGGRRLTAASLSELQSEVQITPATGALRISRRLIPEDEAALYLVFNESLSPVEADLTFPEEGEITVCDAESGTVRSCSAEGRTVHWHFHPGEFTVFAIGLEADEPRDAECGQLIQELLPVSLQPIRHYAFTLENGWRPYADSQPPQPVTLGDWRDLLGDNFSGDAIYRFTVQVEKAQEAIIDLGDVKYQATVQFNSDDPETRLWGPFQFRGQLAEGANTIKVCVTNTLANAILDPALEADWKERFAQYYGGYDQTAREFERESLPSGLFGPVKIYTAEQ